MRRLHFLVNPLAGRGKALKAWEQISAQLPRLHQAVENTDQTFSYTHTFVGKNQPAPFPLLSPLLADDILVAIGGDGSVHHSAVLALQSGCALGVVPTGTGNDFANFFGLSKEPLTAFDEVLNGSTQEVDVVSVNGQVLVNAGGFGLDASVVHFIEGHPRLKRLGPLGYAVSLPIVLGNFKTFSAVVAKADREERFDNVSLVAIGNGPSFGGGMQVVPQANPLDGEVDLCIVSGLNKLQLLRVFPSIYRGSHILNSHVHLRRVARVSIRLNRELDYGEFDGEPVHVERELDIQIQPKRLKLVVPRTFVRNRLP